MTVKEMKEELEGMDENLVLYLDVGEDYDVKISRYCLYYKDE